MTVLCYAFRKFKWDDKSITVRQEKLKLRFVDDIIIIAHNGNEKYAARTRGHVWASRNKNDKRYLLLQNKSY